MTYRRFVAVPFLVAVAAAVVPSWAQVLDKAELLEPANGAIVGTRPRFRIGIKGTDLLKMQFRIEMSRDAWETISYTFDQKEDRSGWGYQDVGGDYGAAYFARKPLDDGTYEWRVSVWNGIEWVRAKDTRRIVIDGVPPGDVDRLRMTVDRTAGVVTLEWDPVLVDRLGRSERVRRYHVYRYQKKTFFFVIRPFQLATVEDTRYEDRDPKALDAPVLYYKITAEDEAGNEPDKRY